MRTKYGYKHDRSAWARQSYRPDARPAGSRVSHDSVNQSHEPSSHCATEVNQERALQGPASCPRATRFR